MQIDVVGNGSIKLTPVNHPSAYQQGRVQAYGAPMRASTSGSRTPIGDEWDLDCEICGRHGPNMVSPTFHLVRLGLMPHSAGRRHSHDVLWHVLQMAAYCLP